MTKSELKVLICDDSILARKNLRSTLNECGIKNIFEVCDGQSAIDTYKTERPDIVFLDIVMPVKDGITALKEICQFKPDAYVVMVSSVGTQMHLRESVKSGAKDFLQKPPAIEQVEAVITRAVGGDSQG